MSNNKKVSDKKVSAGTAAIVLLIAGGLGLLGYGISKVAGWLSEREKIKQQLIQEYLRELDELVKLQAAVAEKGAPISDADQQRIDTMVNDMKTKELTIRSYDVSWVTDLVNAAGDFFIKMGWGAIMIGVATIVGFITLQILRNLFRRRPPRPPTFQCPKDGLVFIDEAALKEHIRAHQLTTVQAILSAQAVVESQPTWVRDIVYAEAGVYSRGYQPWNTLSTQEVSNIIYGMAYAIAIGIVLWGLFGPAAAACLVLL